jgi:hypothetical protein
MAWSSMPTLYKNRGVPLKRPVCAICVDRTRGRTEEVRLSNRVTVWLCAGHARTEFQTQRGGRDFVRTLAGVWRASGCLTVARDRARSAHLERLRGRPPRPRPGSYAWPDLRRRLESRYAGGATPLELEPQGARRPRGLSGPAAEQANATTLACATPVADTTAMTPRGRAPRG